MTSQTQLARAALTAALRTRHSLHVKPIDPISPYDAAESLGIEVRLLDLPSMEGMYCRLSTPLIIVSTLRPQGRQAFTCAHELGHHSFKHGTQVDQLLEDSRRRSQSSEEFLADVFAAFLLMPKLCVSNAFARRGVKPEVSTPGEVFAIAQWLGVGYSTLVNHMLRSLSLISAGRATLLLSVKPKDIRTQLVPASADVDLFIVDTFWSGRAVDLQTEDLILSPPRFTADGNSVHLISSTPSGVILQAGEPGRATITASDGRLTTQVRVARRGFVGRACFRHLEKA